MMMALKIHLSELLAPSFFNLHRTIQASQIGEVWCKGGRGSTKSSFFSLEIFLLLAKDPDAHAFISRRYDTELRDTVFGQMQWACGKLGLENEWRFMVSPMQAVNERTKQKIMFRGVDNPLRTKSINPGHGYLKIFWAEEVDQYGSMAEIRSIEQSLFRGEGGKRMSFFSYNPPKSARAWVNQEVKIPKVGRLVHHSDYLLVPDTWLGERFMADADHLKMANETAYRHEYLGEEVGTGLEVFNNLNVRIITNDEKAQFGQIAQGLDFGFAADPLAFERIYYDPKRRRLWMFDEIAGVGIFNRVLAERMTLDMKRTLTSADSAEPKSIAELSNDHGLKIRGCTKGPGSIEHGIKWLSELTEIIIDPITCPMAAKEHTNYALSTTRNGDIISRYPDKDNHSIDSSRYALMDEIRSLPKKHPLTTAIPIASRWN
jgi:PBSX family phage terminase large subunit